MRPDAVSQQARLSPQVVEQLRNVRTNLGVLQIAERIWNEVLSADDRRQLGERAAPAAQRVGDPPLRDLIVRHWADVRGFSPDRVMLDLALEASVIDAGLHRRLLRQLGEEADDADNPPKPVWDRERGELKYRGDRVRKVSSRATNIRRILDAFQEDRWPARVDNPLSGGADSKKLRDALNRLNQGLHGLRFFADGTASGILWCEA
ncbi:MAG TPA: hypothetical protein PKC18_07420 [Lacipirellulaceae bacterium]|nr:hypothetical protein [Lacipirellulaceae bacterium]HMP06338.1 hypothetical protein [Lacipirellulaceae bacterium]